jgi:hydrogenase/urease accessory protein HupE
MKTIPLRIAIGLIVFGLPFEAHAHLVNTRLGDFYGGMLHPLTGVEDILPWLALAMLAGLQGPARARWLLLVFPAGLVAGGLLSLVLPGLTVAPSFGIALVAMMGISVAAALVLPLSGLVALGALVALTTGYQNGRAMTELTDHLLFIGGVATIGYMFITLAISGMTVFLQGGGGWRQIAARAGGSWVAAIGIMVLGLQLFRPTI